MRHNNPRAKGGDRRSAAAFRLRHLTLGFELRRSESPGSVHTSRRVLRKAGAVSLAGNWGDTSHR